MDIDATESAPAPQNYHINDMYLCVRTYTCLSNAGLLTTDVICAKTGGELLREVKNFGKVSLRDLIDALTSRGLTLSEPKYPQHVDVALHPECPFCCCRRRGGR